MVGQGLDRSDVFWAACLGMLLFGITLTTLGSVLPELITRYGLDKTSAGSLLTLMSFGILFGSLFFGPIVDRYGHQYLLVGAALLVLIGLETIAYSATFAPIRVAVLVFGLGGGMLNGGTNAVVSDLSDRDRGADLSLLGVFFGLGAFGVPLVLGLFAHVATYTTLLGALGAGVLLVAGFFLLVSFPDPTHPHRLPVGKAVELLTHRPLHALAAILFLESGMEITIGGWATTFFNEELEVASRAAAYYLSLFWMGLTFARLVFGWILNRFASGRVLLACLGLAFVASVAMVTTSSVAIAGAAIFLLGAGLSAVYPIILGFIGEVYPELSGTAFSIALAIGISGGMVVPYVAGFLGDLHGLRLSFLVVPLSLLAMALIFVVAQQRFRVGRPDTFSHRRSFR